MDTNIRILTIRVLDKMHREDNRKYCEKLKIKDISRYRSESDKGEK